MAPLALPLAHLSREQEGLPPGFLAGSAFLRAHGLGDPQGGAYRSTHAIASSRWAYGPSAEIHGWAFPDGRFVSRQGLTYVGIQETEPADLEADVATEERAPRDYDTIRESARRVEAATLLVGGRPDLARRLLATIPTNDSENADREMVVRYILRRYGQAVQAHVKGDDHEAGRVEEGLVDAAEAYDRAARPGDFGWWPLSGIQALARDTRRRLTAARPKPPKDEAGRQIAGLEDIGLLQHGLPGGIEFIDAVPVRRLIALGDKAVDPLIDCIENDRRLTRSASFGQMESVEVETVEAAARTALFGILGVSVFTSAGDGVPASSLRAYWTAHRRETPLIRALGLLSDESQEPGIWQESAERLFGVRRLAHFFDRPIPIGQGLKLPSKAMRTPALAGLLLKRARFFDHGRSVDLREYDLHEAARLAAMLTLLDRERGLTHLAEITREAGGLLLNQGGSQPLEETIASGSTFRAEHGDPEAWSDYRSWLTQRREKVVLPLSDRPFAPLIERRNDPAMREAAAAFFGPNSPWRPLAMAKAGFNPESLFVSPLLALPEVREGVMELLRDRTPAGSLTVESGTGLYYIHKGGKWIPMPRPADVPPNGTVVPLRLADLFADRLANLDGAPRYHPWLPEAARERSLQALVRFVEARRDRLYRGNAWGKPRP